MGEILVLPLQQKICTQCKNVYLGVYGLYCGAFREEINDESIADECEEYDP